MPYLTPDIPSGDKYVTVTIPDSLLPVVVGSIAELINSHHWELFGDLTVDECVAYGHEILDSIQESDTPPGEGALNFIDLLDVPQSYTDQANKILTVSPGEDGISFSTPPGDSPLVFFGEQVLAQNTATLSLGDIPTTCTELIIEAYVRSTRLYWTWDSMLLNVNADMTDGNYRSHIWLNYGSQNDYNNTFVGNIVADQAPQHNYSPFWFRIMNYSDTENEKFIQIRGFDHRDHNTINMWEGYLAHHTTPAIEAVTLWLAYGPYFLAGSKIRAWGLV